LRRLARARASRWWPSAHHHRRAAAAYRAGADSLAVARDLIGAADPCAQARAFLAQAAAVRAGNMSEARPNASQTAAHADPGFIRGSACSIPP